MKDKEICTKARDAFNLKIFNNQAATKQLECACRFAYWYMDKYYPDEIASWGRSFQGYLNRVQFEQNRKYQLSVALLPERSLRYMASLGTSELVKHITLAAEEIDSLDYF